MKKLLILIVSILMISCNSTITEEFEKLQPKLEEDIHYQVSKWKAYKSGIEELKDIDYSESPDAVTLEQYKVSFQSVSQEITNWIEVSDGLKADVNGLDYSYKDLFPNIVNWAEEKKITLNSYLESEIINDIIKNYSSPIELSDYELIENLEDVVRYSVTEKSSGLKFYIQLNKESNGYRSSLKLDEESYVAFLK